MNFKTSIYLATATSLLASNALAQETQTEETVDLAPVVVTSSSGVEAGQITFDPRLAIQPLPANDGADALKHVTGFSVIRKGGTDGDPTFRGMAGSRLGILLDGACTLGGCGNRMDPPTAYVFPTSYDKVTVLKGPQSVQHGPGASAGVVLFERSATRLTEEDISLKLVSNFASFGRSDVSSEALVGNRNFYARFQSSFSESDDYEDGDGVAVSSAYERWNAQLSLGYTPSESSALEFSITQSDGEAAYADRLMDGVAFDRSAYSLRYREDQLSGPVRSIDAQVYYNYVDHVMDNFSLREFTPSAMMAMPMLSNPDRQTYGGSVKFELDRRGKLDSILGVDAQHNRHRLRTAMGAATASYQDNAWTEDGTFDQIGLFGEFEYTLSDRDTLAFGARLDSWEATDKRAMIRVGMGNMMANPTANTSRSDVLPSAYLRFERELENSDSKLYAGIGHSERFPDYWEAFSKESETSISAFNTLPEKVTQLDMGTLTRWGDFELNLSTFLANHQDFILIESGYPKTMGSMIRSATVARNIDATTWGGEAKLSYQNERGWYASSSLAYTHGTNDTDGLPLAQISPLELTLEGGRRTEAWSFGWLARLADDQDRVAVNQGNIVGQDIGPSESFAVLSLHSSYQVSEYWSLAAGVDNILDETYAEHISRAGSMIAGYTQTTRINEPGRTFWTRLSAEF
ncbi:TonB-dependent copper receptor [Pelagicoccus albus]|uniref:TonB-dependent copper receptor n=1 Tax=Pelagicoccus albus TaxID=415222 RepID=A0A7X1B8C5_9BACT|nr:TonB-dependent copper receptor [Pelagicoccus albus]MBC2607254.1 TonB-dependent copper receptor [Pelagicoccus albus]